MKRWNLSRQWKVGWTAYIIQVKKILIVANDTNLSDWNTTLLTQYVTRTLCLCYTSVWYLAEIMSRCCKQMFQNICVTWWRLNRMWMIHSLRCSSIWGNRFQNDMNSSQTLGQRWTVLIGVYIWCSQGRHFNHGSFLEVFSMIHFL